MNVKNLKRDLLAAYARRTWRYYITIIEICPKAQDQELNYDTPRAPATIASAQRGRWTSSRLASGGSASRGAPRRSHRTLRADTTHSREPVIA